MLRRVVAMVVVLACAGVVVAYQVTRPDRAPADPRVFVPSPQLFEDFSPSFRTSIADAYYLNMVQYYGEHVEGDGRLDSLPAMVNLVTTLSPHFTRAYLFGAFALVDAGRTDVAYAVLERLQGESGRLALPGLPRLLRVSVRTEQGQGPDRRPMVREGSGDPRQPRVPARLAAALLSKGGDDEKAILMWGQAYLAGDNTRARRLSTAWSASCRTTRRPA